jgi:hypothetical protein
MPHLPRPFASLLPTIAAAAVAGACLASASPARAQGAATAQAAVDGFQAALDAGDAKAAVGYLTPAGQKLLARETVMNCLMTLVFMDPDDPMPGGPKPSAAELAKRKKVFADVKTKITAALKPSGLDAAIGQPMMPAEKIVDEKLPAADAATLVPTLFDIVKKAAPDLGLPGAPRLTKFGPVTGLKVDGDKATMKSGPRTVNLEKVGGAWRINYPLPEPTEPAQ